MKTCEVCAVLGAGGLLWAAYRVYDERIDRKVPWTAITCVFGALSLYMRRDAAPKL